MPEFFVRFDEARRATGSCRVKWWQGLRLVTAETPQEAPEALQRSLEAEARCPLALKNARVMASETSPEVLYRADGIGSRGRVNRPQQRYRYTIEWTEILSQREQVSVKHKMRTCAATDGRAFANICYRLEQATGAPRGTYAADALQMRIIEKTPLGPAAKQRQDIEPAPMLF